MPFFRKNGYVVVRALFDDEEMKLVQAVCQSDPNLAVSLKTVVDNTEHTWGASVWTGLNDSLVSAITRTARMVEIAETIAGGECYHMYSKIVQKPPHDKSIVRWHQAFPSWYDDGVPFPDKATDCSIAVTENTKANGCLQVIEKSHLLGRIDRIEIGNTVESDPKHIERALRDLKIVDCEMDIGDTVFFHPNTVHGSQQNTTDNTRILMHCHYNAMSNRPFAEGLEAHSCLPLEKLPDSAIKDGIYTIGFDPNAKDWNWYNKDPEEYLKAIA
ncbi:MAG: phytanoyl-CoA dioxygenase family protein [Methylococcales bacterium]|nr:phytanoyl-CoA dioxygenase family protein [Methylococcales bacterium]